MRSRQAIVNVMLSWLGCKEGDSTHKRIIDIYNSHKPLARGYKVKYTDAWCATTVSAAAIMCGYTGIIGNTCPQCGRKEGEGEVPFERIRRITGYLVGTLDSFNDAIATFLK